MTKLTGNPIQSTPTIHRIVELRTVRVKSWLVPELCGFIWYFQVLEKIRPLDQKLKYQIDKLVKTATTGIGMNCKCQGIAFMHCVSTQHLLVIPYVSNLILQTLYLKLRLTAVVIKMRNHPLTLNSMCRPELYLLPITRTRAKKVEKEGNLLSSLNLKKKF